ncbi:hypothetical protein LY90DRAFT_517177 [Neocallimastix californiae]|uniref:Uncharacterized protein n=1 Tax=Neocallimastix californiae TaxID=1754190 RepID=A0A1Y2ABP7_9FUNG|nr:hypothetical protein LY90DRAFT_517177 [Neocallimastix californiae]|eukprot:ORY19969.1 hypothetical protein LY90DRAFT_517177 [Neocallimastix californiae]
MTRPNEPTEYKNNTLPVLLPNPNTQKKIINNNINDDSNNSSIKDEFKPNLSQINNFIYYKKEDLLIPVQRNGKKSIKKVKKESNMLLSSKTASRREADRLRKAKSRSNPANAVFEASRERVKRHVKNKYKFLNINAIPTLNDLPRRQPCHDWDIFYHISPYEDPETIDLNERYYNSGIEWPKYVQDIMKFISNQNQNTILNAVRASSRAKYNKWVSELKEKEDELKTLFEAKIYYHQRRESDYKEAWAKYCETGKATKEDIDSYYLRLKGLEHNLMENQRIAKEFWEKNKKYFDVETVSVILSNTPNEEKITITVDKNGSSKKDHEKSKTRKHRTSSKSNPEKVQSKSSNKPPVTIKPSSSVLNSVLPQLTENISDEHYSNITENINDQKINDQKINDQKINDQKINDQNINDQKINDQKINDQNINDQNINDQKINDQKINDQNLNENFVKMNSFSSNSNIDREDIGMNNTNSNTQIMMIMN